MDTSSPLQDDPDKIEKPTDQTADDDAQPFTNQIKTGTAREIPDEDVLKEIWQSVGGDYTNPEPEEKPAGGIGGFIKQVTDRLMPLKASVLPTEVKSAVDPQNSPEKKSTSVPSDPEKVIKPAQKHYPFDSSDDHTPAETTPLSRNEPRNLSSKKTQESRRTSELKNNPATGHLDDEIARRIKEIRSETANRGSEPATSAPTFIFEDDADFDEGRDTLAGKVKRGALPPETIKLLITNTMPEADVISVCRELGIDWLQIPVKTRDEKIQFLIDYFTKKNLEEHDSFGREQTHPASKPAFHPELEQDWLESDSRLQALQESLLLPESEVEKPKITFLEHLKEEFDQSSTFIRVLMVSLSILAVGLVAVIVFFLFSGKTAPVFQPSPTYTQFPTPRALQFPGGWIFNLKTGSVREGIWNPTSPEWLDTTEICRLVSLPWNKQLNAVYLTFEPGDEILMTMSNGDLIKYKVETTKTIPSSEIMDQLTNCTSPNLVVVLSRDESDERQVLIAALNNTLLNAPVTVTAMP